MHLSLCDAKRGMHNMLLAITQKHELFYTVIEWAVRIQ